MIGIVRIALRRPYTFVVLALLILIIGPLAAKRTPVDIFPEIRIPVIAVIWSYTGLPPDQMAGRIATQFQRALTTTVNDIEHMEATSYNGLGIIKVFFQPNVDIRIANAQVTAISQTMLRQLPPGTTPPLVMVYNASTVPILQIALSGSGMSEQQLADLGLNVIRTPLVTVPGAAIPFPYGGKTRQIQIDLDASAMQARGLSGQDVANALAAQNLITPVGSQKIGGLEYAIQLNNAPAAFEALGDLPIKSVSGAMVYIRDVAQVRDGNPPQQNIVHVDGNRSVLMQVLKNGAVSTLDIIDGIKGKLVEMKPVLPQNLKVELIGDQSLFVKGAVNGVIHEGIIAAALTSLMILIFLGSWRSTVIIAISIPLSILGSIAMLSAMGETLNIMTLGGLALAVGILVDDATVTIENINWHLEQGKEVEPAIMDGAAQIVTPAFVSLLCICIVFVPMFFLEGVARFLFVPMALAVMSAMICSFILSRTLVPTMAKYLLRPHAPHTDMHGLDGPLPRSRNPLVRFQRGFEARFERFRLGYRELLVGALAHRKTFATLFMLFVLGSFALVPYLGRDFFPTVDSGQILVHVRTKVGTRVEESANQFADFQKEIRKLIPPNEIAAMVDNIGLPVSGINLTYSGTGTIGSQDGTMSQPDRRQSEEAEPVLSRRALRFAALVLVALAVGTVALGITTRKMADARLNEWTEQQAIPYVSVIAPDSRGRRASIDLPGRLEAYTQAQLYARVSGYLKNWHADIGTPVQAGQLLAEIDAPDLDQQIMQAIADLASAQANAELARTTLERGQSLIKSGAVSQQTLDERQAVFSNRQGLVKSSQANVDRLRVLEKYKRITAPFDGMVTARATDVGALINAGSGGGPALFVVSDTAKLRVYVNVPQNYVPSIRVGTKAEIRVPEYPGRTFTATVEASAQAVDMASGTTRMQLVVANSGRELMTGAFANVRLMLPQPEIALTVPASALIFDQGGLRIAVVGADNRVALKQITIARDHGREVEIGSGLSAGDRVVDSPPDGIADGDRVRVTGGSKAGGEAKNEEPKPVSPDGKT